MIAVIYRFHLKPEQVTDYQKHWNCVTDYFISHRGAIGSVLHQGEDNLWVAYSRWPDLKTRDAAWPGEKAANDTFPETVKQAISAMQALKTENADLPHYDEICLEVDIDKLTI
jgi:hypothetical protein